MAAPTGTDQPAPRKRREYVRVGFTITPAQHRAILTRYPLTSPTAPKAMVNWRALLSDLNLDENPEITL